MESVQRNKQDQKQTMESKIKHESKKNPYTDSSISMTFDSTSDCGYKSGDISTPTTASEHIPSLSLSDFSSQPTQLDQSVTYDSGLVSDCFSPTSSECFILHKSETTVTEEPKKEKYLLQDIFSQDKDGDTILHLAVVEARSDIIFPLIRLAPHPDFLDITNDLYQTLLHLSALTGKSNIVRRLVVAGATLDIQDHNGNTPLHIASRRGDLDCVQAMLAPINETEVEEACCSYRVYLQQNDLSHLINMKNYDGQSSVHLAASGGFLKVMECLYNQHADINDQDGKTGQTALHYAVQNANFKLVELLLSKCYADFRVRNYAGRTSLRIAHALHKRNPANTRQDILNLLTASVDSFDSSLEYDSDCSSDDEIDLDALLLNSRNSTANKSCW